MRFLNKKLEILSYIYQLRSLAYSEINKFLFEKDNLSESYCHKLIREMVAEKVLEKMGFHKKDMYFFITSSGIKELKKHGYYKLFAPYTSPLPLLLPAHKLKINESNIHHQLELNLFVLSYGTSHSFDYYDEKYISLIFSGMRPDGIIQENGTMLFLEMDMNTEGKRALLEKWKHYRNFLKSEEYYNMRDKVLVLFILGGGITEESKRATYLREQITTYLSDYIADDFNFIIGTEQAILNTLDTDNSSIIKTAIKKNGYNVQKGTVNDGSLSGYTFDLYLNMLSPEGRLITKGGYTEEYVLDDMTDSNIYSYAKLKNANSFMSAFKFQHNRELKYIVVTKTEEDAYRYFLEIPENNNIYFTTPSRLSKASLHAALFQMSRDKRKWHFSEDSLGAGIEEGYIN